MPHRVTDLLTLSDRLIRCSYLRSIHRRDEILAIEAKFNQRSKIYLSDDLRGDRDIPHEVARYLSRGTYSPPPTKQARKLLSYERSIPSNPGYRHVQPEMGQLILEVQIKGHKLVDPQGGCGEYMTSQFPSGLNVCATSPKVIRDNTKRSGTTVIDSVDLLVLETVTDSDKAPDHLADLTWEVAECNHQGHLCRLRIILLKVRSGFANCSHHCLRLQPRFYW
ncbi:hypothetical protein KCU66_g62, partial [Aureobasidium melanogenum]